MKGPCSIDGCEKPVVGRGWCSTHHKRWCLYGDPCAPDRRQKRGICSYDGCNSPNTAHSFCSKHYQRFMKFGDPSIRKMAPGEASAFIITAAKYEGEDCLTWPFSRTKYGYGNIGPENFGTTLAHRAVCMIAHGPPPSDDHESAHSCGKGHEGCVNPNHLRWDTRKGNMADKLRHGTHARGERSPKAKLTREDVIEIRRMIPNQKMKDIAEKFGVGANTIRCIKEGRSWSWLT